MDKKYIDPNYVRVPFKNMPNPFNNFCVPESWENVEDFSNWWIGEKMPMQFPLNPEVFMSDDATAICLFRKGRFQVELYLIHPMPEVPVHEHPGVEVIKVRTGLGRGITFSDVLRKDQAHGSGMKLEAEKQGFPLIAIQHWLTREPTTIASMWKGYTAGPKHRALIQRFNPGCFIDGDYADITKTQEGESREF